MKKTYQAPLLEKLGRLEEITRVGQTNPGNDMLPLGAQGRDGGSIEPPGLGGSPPGLGGGRGRP